MIAGAHDQAFDEPNSYYDYSQGFLLASSEIENLFSKDLLTTIRDVIYSRSLLLHLFSPVAIYRACLTLQRPKIAAWVCACLVIFISWIELVCTAAVEKIVTGHSIGGLRRRKFLYIVLAFIHKQLGFEASRKELMDVLFYSCKIPWLNTTSPALSFCQASHQIIIP